jgi:hypothetical protein
MGSTTEFNALFVPHGVLLSWRASLGPVGSKITTHRIITSLKDSTQRQSAWWHPPAQLVIDWDLLAYAFYAKKLLDFCQLISTQCRVPKSKRNGVVTRDLLVNRGSGFRVFSLCSQNEDFAQLWFRT